ncbi:MAG: hypothetical protein H7Y32_11700, partial [Chloroflexales bacterium]|nr:hypothetical protein [Chloroflexales bacterium]
MVLNEYMAHPSSGGDWVELYNTAMVNVDIGGWQI